MKKILVLLGVLAVIAAAALILTPSRNAAPEFSIQTLEGETLNNQALQGKVTLINFWFPSCPGCVSEMPKLIKMAHDYQGQNFQIWGISVPVDSLAAVEEYARTRALPFAIAFDEHKNVTRLFIKTELYPTSILLDKKGRIIKTFVGEPDFEKLYLEVDEEIAK